MKLKNIYLLLLIFIFLMFSGTIWFYALDINQEVETPFGILAFSKANGVSLNDTTPYYWVTWAVALVILVTQSLESLFLQPYVMGKHTRLHPVAILLGLTIFGSLWGIVGLIVSTPILSVGRSVIQYYNVKYDIF